jgi:hypothetical protein
MKKIFLSLLYLSFSLNLLAQKALPELKVGTVMQCSAFVQGQEFPLVLTLKSISGPVSIAWSVEGYGDGTFEMSAKALEGATMFSLPTQPALGLTKLADTETFGIISKAAYKTLAETKVFTYNGVKFKVKTPEPNPMKWAGKEADVTHIISEDGKIELWILNNPNFPLMVKTAGLPTDILVNEIK